MRTVKGKTVLVTGAAMGMGRMFVERAIAEEAKAVVLWDINDVALNQTLDELDYGFTDVSADVVDVSDYDEVHTAAQRVRDEVGDVHVLVNNAGIVRGNRYFWEADAQRDTALTMNVNTLAPMYVAREFLPGMIASGTECRVVNLASAAGLTANPRMAVYAASKWAVVGWSDSIRLELEQAGHRKVKVTTVCPYYVKTGMFDGAKSAPLLPLLEPEQVVKESWQAMQQGRPFVILPRTVTLSEIMKGVVPVGVRDFLAGRVLGVYHTMDDFKGRLQ